MQLRVKMSNYNHIFDLLKSNPKDIYEETCRLLIKIADNIIKDPSNLKIRLLQKNNATISTKILKVAGGLECLKLMGFKESDQYISLPIDAPLNKMQLVKNEIVKLKNNVASTIVEVKAGTSQKIIIKKAITPTQSVQNKLNNEVPIEMIKKVVLPPFVSVCTNPFLKALEYKFHLALNYDDTILQNRARNMIPVKQLEMNAQEKLRNMQVQIKKDKLKDPELNLQDFLILELLSWFKNDFFEWVDSPDCTKCFGKTVFSHLSEDENVLIYTNRVEMHSCKVCNVLTPFPRYQDLNILLETRKGRCGEWANTFTLLCRAMGWDARHVFDEGDHVWTEVYSFSQKRWLHCDPCEDLCDSPLIYESGWGKQIDYVIAYSGEEVQDVTWRYSSNHKEVLKRRKNCSEKELTDVLIKLRETRQKSLNKSRKDYLTKRLLFELVELMAERKPDGKDQQGRISGSLAWKLGRGETLDANKEFIWILTNADLLNNKLTIQYSTALDAYQKIGDKMIESIKGWNNGAFESNGVIRKHEKDWKMAYLCRNKGVSEGNISWKFKIDCNKVIDHVSINVKNDLYEDGKVNYLISNKTITIKLNSDEATLATDDFSGSKILEITAYLSGGKGDCGWQHAQLFRQSDDASEFPFNINFTFKNDI